MKLKNNIKRFRKNLYWTKFFFGIIFFAIAGHIVVEVGKIFKKK